MKIAEIIAEHNETGQTFFGKEEMRIFNSRVSSYTRGRFFVTSERMDWEHPRMYTVRVLSESGSIEGVNNFQEYPNLRSAKKALDEAYIKHLEGGE